jgi:hypothetical protein
MKAISIQTIKSSRKSPKKMFVPMIKSLRKLEDTFDDEEFFESKKQKTSFQRLCETILKEL